MANFSLFQHRLVCWHIIASDTPSHCHQLALFWVGQFILFQCSKLYIPSISFFLLWTLNTIFLNLFLLDFARESFNLNVFDAPSHKNFNHFFWLLTAWLHLSEIQIPLVLLFFYAFDCSKLLDSRFSHLSDFFLSFLTPFGCSHFDHLLILIHFLIHFGVTFSILFDPNWSQKVKRKLKKRAKGSGQLQT